MFSYRIKTHLSSTKATQYWETAEYFAIKIKMNAFFFFFIQMTNFKVFFSPKNISIIALRLRKQFIALTQKKRKQKI